MNVGIAKLTASAPARPRLPVPGPEHISGPAPLRAILPRVLGDLARRRAAWLWKAGPAAADGDARGDSERGGGR